MVKCLKEAQSLINERLGETSIEDLVQNGSEDVMVGYGI
jgi:hypothetical protein